MCNNLDRWGVIAASVRQISSLGYQPIVLKLNYLDAVMMGLSKDATGKYIGVPKMITDLGISIIE